MKINDRLQHFDLKGTDGSMHSSKDFKDKKGLLIIVSCNHCPYAQAYIGRIRELVENYRDQIGIVAINGNDASRYPMDSYDNMKPMAEKLGLPKHYLHDSSQKVLTHLRAERTPEVFLFNSDDLLVYHGAIDDKWDEPEEVSQTYLKDAMDALLKDEQIEPKQTPAVGCSIKWKPQAQ